jgi:RNA recognition motif-containing protein
MGQAVPANYMAQQYTPAQLAQYQAGHSGQAHFRQPSIQQQPVQPTHNGKTTSGLPVNTRNGAAIVEPRAVFVQGLSYKARESDIQALFNIAGKVVSCKLQVDPRTRKSKGCAKVEYNSTQEAELAIYHCNRKEWMGRQLSVRMDRDITVVTPPTPATDQRPVIVDGSLGGRSRSKN